MFCIDCGSNSLSIDGVQDTSDEIVTPHLSARVVAVRGGVVMLVTYAALWRYWRTSSAQKPPRYCSRR